MIRHFNYTGRKSIDQHAVSIQVGSAPDYFVDAQWVFENLKLPPEALVIVEAYTGGSVLIILQDWGTVANRVPPQERSLRELSASRFLFNLKVVDVSTARAGQILAVARSIRPASGLAGPRPKSEELVFVNAKSDMGHELWNLDFSHDHVWLNVNAKVADFDNTVRSDPKFFALVYPQLVRQVLSRALSEAESWEPIGWCGKWLNWALQSFGEGEKPRVGHRENEEETEMQTAWVDRIVRRFCEDKLALEKWNGSQEVKP